MKVRYQIPGGHPTPFHGSVEVILRGNEIRGNLEWQLEGVTWFKCRNADDYDRMKELVRLANVGFAAENKDTEKA